MATVTKRGTTWRAQIRRAGFSPVSETFDTKAQAQAWATAREADLQNMRKGRVVEKSVRHAMLKYLEEVAPTLRGKDSASKINTLLGTFSDKRKLPFADRLMSEVSQEDIDDWMRELRTSGLKPNTLFGYFEILARIFRHARTQWNYLKFSPFDDMAWPVKAPGRKRRPSADELQRLMLALNYEPGMMPTEENHYVAIGMWWCIETAMRVSEMLGLDDKSIINGGKVAHLEMTKNGSARDVPLSAAARELLALLPKRGKLIPIRDYNRFAKLFDRARRSARVKGLTFHDTRREGTTRLARKVEVLTLAKITGHKDLKVLLNTYYQPDMGDVADQL